jgi:hypothetical protein
MSEFWLLRCGLPFFQSPSIDEVLPSSDKRDASLVAVMILVFLAVSVGMGNLLVLGNGLHIQNIMYIEYTQNT